jgi:hypothetical protein
VEAILACLGSEANHAWFGGQLGAIPVVGDWNGAGKSELGIYENGNWYRDLSGTRAVSVTVSVLLAETVGDAGLVFAADADAGFEGHASALPSRLDLMGIDGKSHTQGLKRPQRGDGAFQCSALAAVPLEALEQFVGFHERVAKGRAEGFGLLDQARHVLLSGLRLGLPGLAVGFRVAVGCDISVRVGDRFGHR